jgi:hypothetical protein
MEPYTNFFLGSVTVAGALTGLLFVALSLAPQRLTGDSASVEYQSIAATAFTGLVDSLWLSLAALIPGNGLRVASLILGLLGLTSTAGLTLRLLRARSRERLSARWPLLLPLIVVLYGFQMSTFVTAPSGRAAQSAAATFVLIFFGVGIARSWELLGLRGGGLLDLLVIGADQARRRGSARDEHDSSSGAARA